MTIEWHEAMPWLVAACPWFADAWQQHQQAYGYDTLHVAAGEFADQLLQRFRAGDAQALTAAAAALEQLHLQGSAPVQELATTGLLESVQNVWGSAGVDPEQFGRLLLPESRRWWDELNRFWSAVTAHGGT